VYLCQIGFAWELPIPEHTLTNHYHAAVWIDHHEVRVFHFNATDVDEIVVQPEHPTRHIHHKANSIGSGQTSEDHAFFQDVISAIGTASAILVTGPANAKTKLIGSAISISDARFAQEFAPHGFSSVTLDRDGSFLSADLRRGCGNCVVSPKYSWGRMELAALRAQLWQKRERREVRARLDPVRG